MAPDRSEPPGARDEWGSGMVTRMSRWAREMTADAGVGVRGTVAVAAVLATGLSGCGGPSGEQLEIAGPSSSSSTIVDLPAGPISNSTAIVESRLRSAGVGVSAIDRQQGFITARTQSNRFVDCGTIFETVGGATREFPGNAQRLVLADPDNPNRSLVRTVAVDTSAGIGITQGVTNTVVVRQQHRVTIGVSTTGGQQISTETREFTDRGFARFEDGTICRSSDAMNRAVM